MAFNDPPNILAGISHPQVISTPGAGEAMAGGLSAVLASILQKQQLDQQHQQQQADMAAKQAQTEHELALAKMTDADTANKQQELKDNKKKAQDLLDQQQYERTALGFVNAHLDKVNDFGAMMGAAHQAIQAGAIPQDIIPYIGGMVQKVAGVNKDVSDALKVNQETQKNAAQLPYAGPQAAADLKLAQGKPDLQKAQTAEAWANALKAKADAAKAGQGGDLKPLPQKARETIVNQRDMLTQIDQAIQMLQANPNAIGPAKGMIPPHVLDIFDANPGNVATRAALQNIRADRLHSLYGSRLTKTEIEQGSQIFADVRTPSKVALTKLQQLRERIAKLNQGYEKGLVGQGYRPFAADDAVETGAAPAIAAPAASAAAPVDYQSRYIQLRKQGMSATQAYKALQGQ